MAKAKKSMKGTKDKEQNVKNKKDKLDKAKGKKGDKELSPLEKARIARASGKGGKSKAKKKKAGPIWVAPEDFKPHFLEVRVRTDKDGLFGADIKATRFQGRYDPDAEDKKKADLGSYDPRTLFGLSARLSGATFHPSTVKFYPQDIKERNATETVKDKEGQKKQKLVYRSAHRLPPNTTFQILMRIGKKSADSSLTARITTIWQVVKNPKTGKVGLKELEKTDPATKRIKRAKNQLPAAFKNVQMPPKRTRGGRKVKEQDDD